jgi:hypothetical protein
MRDGAISDLESAESNLETAIETFLANVQVHDALQAKMQVHTFASNQKSILRYLYTGGLRRARSAESSTSQPAQVKCAT